MFTGWPEISVDVSVFHVRDMFAGWLGVSVTFLFCVGDMLNGWSRVLFHVSETCLLFGYESV